MADTISSKSEYTLVLRAEAGAYFGPLDSLTLNNFPTDIGPANFNFRTVRQDIEGFKHPIRLGLRVEVKGYAASLQQAVESWANATRGLTTALCIASNAPIDEPTLDIAFDSTPGREEREYCRGRFLKQELSSRRGRRIDPGLATALILAWWSGNKDKKSIERWLRVLTAYHHALQEWEPGHESIAIGYLWIGMEALTKIAKDHFLESKQISESELIALWGTDEDNLNAETRLRLLFKDDKPCYQNAKAARNGRQHAYMTHHEVRTKSMKYRDQTATYLRNAILEFIGLDPAVESGLTTSPYDQPYAWTFISYMWGTLISDGTLQNKTGIEYPVVNWDLIPREGELDADGDAAIDFDIMVDDSLLADEVEFECTGLVVLQSKSDV